MIAAKKWLFWKRSWCSEEKTAPIKYLLCRSSYSEELSRSSFSGNKVVLKKLQHMWEEKSPFEKKNPKLNYWLRLVKIIFPERFPQPDKCTCGTSYNYLSGSAEPTGEEIIKLCSCHTIFINKKLPQFLLLTVNISS